MRKGLVIALVAGALVLGVAVGANAESIRKSITVDYKGYQIKVNGQVVNTGDSQPFLVVDEGRTYVPARYLAEALGAKVGFEATTNTVTVATPGYVEPVKDGDSTTYKLPYFGASIRVPSSLQPLNDNMNLLNLASLDSEVVVNPTQYQPGRDFDAMVSLNLQQMSALGMLTAPSAQQSLTVPGATKAVEVTGLIQVNNLKYPARVRFIGNSEAFWVVIGRYNATSDPDGAKAAAILATFSLAQ
jgi:hypothetical protein